MCIRDSCNTVTVNGEHYQEMITNYFWHQLYDIDVEDMWFQQDGATCHTVRETIQLLHTKFPGSVISRFGDQHWPDVYKRQVLRALLLNT